jgi:hypothetical protein
MWARCHEHPAEIISIAFKLDGRIRYGTRSVTHFSKVASHGALSGSGPRVNLQEKGFYILL